MGNNIKPQDRSTSANRALEKFTKAPWLCFPLNCKAIHEPFLNFSLPLHAGFLCSVNGRSCTNGLENVFWGGVGGGNPLSAAPMLGLQRKLRPPALHRKQS